MVVTPFTDWNHGLRDMIPRSNNSSTRSRRTQVVPLTGDASDRRYFRVLLKDAKPIVLALHAGPIDFDAMPFVAVARLLARSAAAGAARSCITRTSSASSASRISATSRCRRTSAPRPPAEHAALYRQAVDVHRPHAAARRGACAPTTYPPYRIAFDIEKLTWELEFFVKHYLHGLQGRRPVATPSARRCARNGRRSSRSWPPSRACCAIATITAAT